MDADKTLVDRIWFVDVELTGAQLMVQLVAASLPAEYGLDPE